MDKEQIIFCLYLHIFNFKLKKVVYFNLPCDIFNQRNNVNMKNGNTISHNLILNVINYRYKFTHKV